MGHLDKNKNNYFFFIKKHLYKIKIGSKILGPIFLIILQNQNICIKLSVMIVANVARKATISHQYVAPVL